MAKFCGNCGSQMDDNAKICGNCGTPFLESTDAPHPIKMIDPEKQKEQKKKIKKAVSLIVSLIAVILVGVLAFSIITEFTGANGLLRKTMKAIETYDIDTLINNSSDIYYYATEDYAESYFSSSVGYVLDHFETSVGHNYKMSYEVVEKYSLSNRSFSSLLDDLTWLYEDFDTSMIKEVVIVEVSISATQGKKTSHYPVSITMTKEDGSWRVLYIA